MVEPKTEIDRRLDRIEQAIQFVAQSAVAAKDLDKVDKILRGEDEANAT